MKKYLLIFLLLTSILGCKKDENTSEEEKVITNQIISTLENNQIGFNDVSLSLKIDTTDIYQNGYNVGYLVSKTYNDESKLIAKYDDENIIIVQSSKVENNIAKFILENLESNTTYYYRSFVNIKNVGIRYGQIKEFTTLNLIASSYLSIKEIEAINPTTAIIKLDVKVPENIDYKIATNWNNQEIFSGDNQSIKLENLKLNQEYSFKCYLNIGDKTIESQEKSYTFKMDFSNIKIETLDKNTIIKAEIKSNFLTDGSQVELFYDLRENGEITPLRSNIKDNKVEFELKNILPNSKYYISLKAIDGQINTKTSFTSHNYSIYGNTPINTPLEYVDLGLSVKWAKTNIGAKNPEDFGAYIAWGELEEKYNYQLSTRNWQGDIVSKTQNNSNWRMPTQEEFQELINDCNWTFVSEKNCWKISNKLDENKFIYLPLAGYYTDKTHYKGTGNYWSKTEYNQDGQDQAFELRIETSKDKIFANKGMYVGYGQSIRAVYDSSIKQ